ARRRTRYGRSEQVDAEDVAVRRALVLGPARVDAGVAPVGRAVVPRDAVRIRIGLGELHDLERLPGRDVVFDETRAFLVAGHHQDRVLHVRDAVRARHAVGDQEFRLPRLRVDAQNAAQPERRNPQLAVHVFHAVAAAAAEWNLAVRDRLRVHVRLENAVRRGV